MHRGAANGDVRTLSDYRFSLKGSDAFKFLLDGLDPDCERSVSIDTNLHTTKSQALAKDIFGTIKDRQLLPSIRTQYYRTAFQVGIGVLPLTLLPCIPFYIFSCTTPILAEFRMTSERMKVAFGV
jgi:hypothetical protein